MDLDDGSESDILLIPLPSQNAEDALHLVSSLFPGEQTLQPASGSAAAKVSLRVLRICNEVASHTIAEVHGG